jgi:hypothetical protein
MADLNAYLAADLDTIVTDCCHSLDLRPSLKHRLDLLHGFSGMQRKMRATGSGVREQEDEESERLTQSSWRTARSQSHVLEGPSGNNVKRGHKRKASHSLCGMTLTEHAVLHLSKRQKTSNCRTVVKHWLESIQD